jgi:thioester reductase-like protein
MNLLDQQAVKDSAPDWLVSLAAECLNVPAQEIAPDTPLVRYGLDSVAAVQLTAAVAARLGRDVPEWLLLDHPNLRSLAAYIRARAAPGPQEVYEPASALDQMLADCALPADVRPGGAARPAAAAPAVLLTGATGFLGAYLLRALLGETDARVYCLVRTPPGAAGFTRIRRNLESYGIWESSFAARVEPVPGDLLKPGLGLSPDRFAALGRDIDAIYHAAAAVNWAWPYASLRDANVAGTLRLLRLACHHRPKPFHFISSLAVCYSTSGPAEVSEGDDLLPCLPGIHLGYAQTKAVAEVLVRRAGERGLPVAVYRPSLIVGDGRAGTSGGDDLLGLLVRGCVAMGAAPDLDWVLDACPVDYVAAAVVGLSRRDASPGRVFHLAHPEPCCWRDTVRGMNGCGHPVRLVPYAEWLRRLEAETRAPAHPLHTLRPFFLTRVGGATLPELYQRGGGIRVRCDGTRRLLAALPVRCPPLDDRLVGCYHRSLLPAGGRPVTVTVGPGDQ